MNRTRGIVLHKHPAWAITRIEQALGLMFRKPHDECLVLLFMPQRKEVPHMWFVFAPIDILVLDGGGKVVALKERLLPWRTWNPRVAASAIVELPAGTIARTSTRIGDAVALPQPVRSAFWRWHHHLLFWTVQIGLSLALAAIIILLVTILE